MFTVPPSKGIIARRFCLYEITNGEEKTFHAYSDMWSGEWRFSTALQGITLVLNTWHWKTKSGSEYSCDSYFLPELHESFMERMKLHFGGDSIRRVGGEEISELFGE